MKEVTIYNITESHQEYKGTRDWVFERCQGINWRDLQQFPDNDMAFSTIEREVVPVHYLYKFQETTPRGEYIKRDERWVVIHPDLQEVVDEIVGEKYREKITLLEAQNKRNAEGYSAKLKVVLGFNYLPWWMRVKYLFKDL